MQCFYMVIRKCHLAFRSSTAFSGEEPWGCKALSAVCHLSEPHSAQCRQGLYHDMCINCSSIDPMSSAAEIFFFQEFPV